MPGGVGGERPAKLTAPIPMGAVLRGCGGHGWQRSVRVPRGNVGSRCADPTYGVRLQPPVALESRIYLYLTG